MKAIDITGSLPGGAKTPLKELAPLDTPLLLQIFPVYACNFKCQYCTMSIEPNKRGFISDVVKMENILFIKCIEDCLKFKSKIKVLRFVGMGEPLLHKQLPLMIKNASNSGVFERIEVITNASLLTKQMSDDLISSGLTKLLISIQGTSAGKYAAVSGIKLDFDEFRRNIKYFYDNRGNNCKVHIKIVDCALDNFIDKASFYRLFGDMCDTIGVEYVGPIHHGVDYNSRMGEAGVNQYGDKLTSISICSQPFYMMQINPDGNVVPCYSIEYPVILGNCYNESLYDIWHGKNFNQFRLKILHGIDDVDVCKDCCIFKHRACSSDDLSTEVERLVAYYENSNNGR